MPLTFALPQKGAATQWHGQGLPAPSAQCLNPSLQEGTVRPQALALKLKTLKPVA